MPIHRGVRGKKAALLAIAAAPIAACFGDAAQAQTLTWDASSANPAAPIDGSGSWDTTNANWTDGITNFAWVNGDIAAIGNGGTAGTITIDDPSGTVSASGINFNPISSGSYIIAASGADTLAFTGGASISVTGASATISAPIAGAAGMNVGGTGALTLAGNNTFSGPVAINSGGVIVNAGSNLGSSANSVSLGTPTTGTITDNADPTGALTLGAGANVTVGSFKCATSNANAINTIAIGNGAALNVNSNLDGTGTNAVFIVGNNNLAAPITTRLAISGLGALNVTGGSNNSSFLVGLSASNTSSATMLPMLDMSGLANFNFTTGTGPIPFGAGGNEFAVGHGSSAAATCSFAQNTTITAGVLTVGDTTVTPGLSGGGTNITSNPNTLNLGNTANTLNINTFVIGNGRSIGNLQWASGVTTGTLLIDGGAGGVSTADMIIGTCSGGTPASTASALNLNGHSVLVQAGTVAVGNLAGGTGGTSATKGGQVLFDTGTFNIASLRLAVATSGTSGGSIAGTFTVGSGPSSTGVLNVTNTFWIGDVTLTTGAAGAKGTLNVKGGTANIGANIIDVSTTNTSGNAVVLSGGTLNMEGFAIGPAITNPNDNTKLTRHITTITFPALGNNAVLANLGGTGINDAGLTMAGAGILVLEGSSTYSGATTINTGTLQVGQAGDAVPPNSALQAAVTNKSVLAFGSNLPTTSNTVISGTGAVAQNGTGVTTLTGNSTYTGPTLLVNGLLSTASLPNEGAAGGTSSPIGASGNAASNLVLTGGGLQYAGAGGSTDRLFTITAAGGTLDASGSGAIVFNNGGAIVSADPAPRATTDSATSAKVTLPNVADLVVGMSVTGTNIPPGTTIVSINPTASSITLSSIPSAAGADTLSFGTANRTLTLAGTSTAANTLGNALSDSLGGGTLGLTKTGTGAWNLAAANTYTGLTTVQGGTLIAMGSAAWAPALANSNITGGRLVFDYSSDSSPATMVKNALTSSFVTGFSTGPLRSSTASASKGLGWKDDGASKKVTVMYTYFGDANLDGLVDTTDFTQLSQNFGGSGVWATGDFNYDGTVNALDFNAIANNFGSPALGSPALGTLVPEPGTLALSILGLMAGLRRRRR